MINHYIVTICYKAIQSYHQSRTKEPTSAAKAHSEAWKFVHLKLRMADAAGAWCNWLLSRLPVVPVIKLVAFQAYPRAFHHH